ncbi:thiol reductant ABC exporter subunit CydC [Tropicimonas sp. IMCC6043]|uniref:thiol reductant ABC exporter subunit CydC n=1 Tax=Tropicimonas sp. IMCC6043 TaxID=2510645 RepID=UPI00101C2058|nr:thiol reductant ABC exporter subunit CydC [Tropicimonas sp. IMCC6043]RYH08330.1 thiol reductant ABC exporter subunit CydC [Tropicimonas sp. IMCC6043]
MTALRSILALIWRDERRALLRGAALAITVLGMGIALLGLSGWFIAAAGAAGLAGLGAVFDVFRPSAAVRFLALGRTAARYGERLLTHDATLRALARLRIRLLAGLIHAPFGETGRLRGSQGLNRLTADVDALDGIALRLVLPILAGGVTLAGACILLARLVTLSVALWSVGSFAIGAIGALVWAARRSDRPSRRAGAAARAFRVRLIDLLRGRAILAFSGQHARFQADVLAADSRARAAALDMAATERRAGAVAAIAASLATAGALLLGAELARAGLLSPPRAALGFFATLALAETLAPLRRGVAELGGMRDAARRITRQLDTAPMSTIPPAPALALTPGHLEVAHLAVTAKSGAPPVLSELRFSIASGECLALTGRSGIGKTTVLDAVAGLVPPVAGSVRIGGRPLPDWPEQELRAYLGYLPQRTALIGGTVAENLRLARPEASDAELQTALERVALDGVVDDIGGLAAQLGEGGKGLSGGEARRLALARVLLRAPRLLLLDEPTEGLDRATAERVLAGIRHACPEAAILLAAHRPVERDWADRRLDLA